MWAYRQENDGCTYPPASSTLGRWATDQRYKGRKGLLAQNKVDALGGIGFTWDGIHGQHDRKWQCFYKRLQDHRAVNGCCYILVEDKVRLGVTLSPYYGSSTIFLSSHAFILLVTLNFLKENQTLKAWTEMQRSRRKSGLLSMHRIKLLDELGFIWDGRKEAAAKELSEKQWDGHFKELLEYRATHDGSCAVPYSRDRVRDCLLVRCTKLKSLLPAAPYDWLVGIIPRSIAHCQGGFRCSAPISTKECFIQIEFVVWMRLGSFGTPG
jgi:Helicase associated domain